MNNIYQLDYLYTLLSLIYETDINEKYFGWLNDSIDLLNEKNRLVNLEALLNFNKYYLSYVKEDNSEDNIISYICERVLSKVETEIPYLQHNFIQTYYEYLKHDYFLIKKVFWTYAYQNSYYHNEVELLYNLNNDFIYEYIDKCYELNKNLNHNLSFIWNLDFEIISNIMTYIINEGIHNYTMSNFNIFGYKKFNKIINQFLEFYLQNNIDNEHILITIMEIIHEELGVDKFTYFFEKLLSYNCDENYMLNIPLENNGAVFGTFSYMYEKKLDLLKTIEEILSKKYYLSYPNLYLKIEKDIENTKEDKNYMMSKEKFEK